MRYVLLDRITELKPGTVAKGLKCVSLAEDYFVDHFPGIPVMPGALILESLAQLGGTLCEATMRERGHPRVNALLTMIDKAKFRNPVRPGDRLELETTLVAASENAGEVKGQAHVDGKLVAEATITFAFVDVKNEKLLQERAEYLQVLLSGASE
ncbi:MAG TPA: 3-hydroxyacyl-ACP dehydratase FabZ [Myxococcales bacterium]|jgi:3-hydroxymyristoyl/3-hydroxydecanoyl-(acyl carrier protein) dehydratase